MTRDGEGRAAARPVRVAIVDDSMVARRMVIRLLAAEPDIEVTIEAGDGQQAIDALRTAQASVTPCDVVLLDVEMPRLGGLEVLPHILRLDPAPRVIMASTHTRRGATTTVRALSLGAADYVCKPSAEPGAVDEFATDLVAKIRVWSAATRTARGLKATGNGRFHAGECVGTMPLLPPAASRAVRQRDLSPAPSIKAVAIGASTGGPQALAAVLSAFRGHRSVPLLITQHMPATFTPILAEHLGRAAGRPCAEGRDGEPIELGRAYLAPGGHHMLAIAGAGRPVIRITDDPPENFCRPAVDPMFRSLASIYGSGLVAVVLTGMGQDGLRGCEAVARGGGRVIAQDENTSVVWGMPGAVARHGLADEILPLERIGQRLVELVEGRTA
jgi:two-component system chemotaxis response regulator CheB